MLDVTVDPAQHVPLQRRQHRLAVALEDQRSRLVQPVDRRLPQPAAESPPHEPLQLDSPGGSRGQELDQPCMSLIGENAHTLQLVRLQERRITKREGLDECSPPVAWLPFDRTRDVTRNVTPGLSQTHEHEQCRARGVELVKPANVIVHVTSARARVGLASRRRAHFVVELDFVALVRWTARQAQYLHVGLERLERPEQRKEAGALALIAEPLVGRRLDLKCRPGIRQALGKHAIAIREADRGSHQRMLSLAKRSSTTTSPRAGR